MGNQLTQNRSLSKRFNRTAFIAAIRESCITAATQRKQEVLEGNRAHVESLIGEHDREQVGATSLMHDYHAAAKTEIAAKTKNLMTFLEREPISSYPHGKVIVAVQRGEKIAFVVYPGRDEGYGLVSAVGIEDCLGELARRFGFAELHFCSDESGRGQALLDAAVGKRIPHIGEIVKIH